LNLVGATLAAAKAPFAEVAVAMHESISDKAVALHRGTKVRKCHTSRRDAFKTVNAEPLAKVADGQITLLTDDYQPRDHKRKLQLQPNFEEKVALVKFCPGMNPKVIEWYVDEGYRGVILEATGLGHVWHGCFPAIKRAVENGVTVGVTSQCIWGRVNMNVYASGRDLIAMGATPLEDMLAETALVKLMWILGHTRDVEEAKRLLRTNLVNEISKRTVESIEPETAGKERAD
jgi:glutamyl-tRNA(Gln) amidotransferase subunit D